MRSSEKKEQAHHSGQLLGLDFHDFIEKERHASNFELAAEFGLSLKEVRILKKRIQRN